MRYLKYTILLLLLVCSSVTHKPVEIVQLDEVIERIQNDKDIPEDKKIYYEDKLKHAKSTIYNQSNYIIQLETLIEKERRDHIETVEKYKNEIAGLNDKLQNISMTAGRAKQNDYIFWGAIAFALLGIVFFILYLINKFGSKASPVGMGGSIASEAIRKSIEI